MFEIGTSLAAARQAQGLELADAERLTCLRARHLQALEDERFDDLPGHTYARAFLRSYAGTLGLQADLFVAEFDERFPAPDEEFPELEVSRTPLRWGRAARRAAVAALAVAALAGIVAWSAGRSNQARLVPASQVRLQAMPHARTLFVASAGTVSHPALVLTASRGSCWLLVRRSNEAGPVLYEGMLEPGQSLRFEPTVWVRLGAPWNIDAHRGTHVIPNLTGSGAINLTA